MHALGTPIAFAAGLASTHHALIATTTRDEPLLIRHDHSMARARRHLTHIHIHADRQAVVNRGWDVDRVRDHGVPLAAAFQHTCLFRRAVGVWIPTLAPQFAPADFGNVQLAIDDFDVVGDGEAVAIVEATTKGRFADVAGRIVEKSLSGIGLVFQHVADRCERQRFQPRQSVPELRKFLPHCIERQRTRLRLDTVRRFETLIELIRRLPFGEKVIPHETARRREVGQFPCLGPRHRQQPIGDVSIDPLKT